MVFRTYVATPVITPEQAARELAELRALGAAFPQLVRDAMAWHGFSGRRLSELRPMSVRLVLSRLDAAREAA